MYFRGGVISDTPFLILEDAFWRPLGAKIRTYFGEKPRQQKDILYSDASPLKVK
jgi:hypothetical protein